MSGPLELMLVMDPRPSKLVERLRDVVFLSTLAEEILASYCRPSRYGKYDQPIAVIPRPTIAALGKYRLTQLNGFR